MNKSNRSVNAGASGYSLCARHQAKCWGIQCELAVQVLWCGCCRSPGHGLRRRLRGQKWTVLTGPGQGRLRCQSRARWNPELEPRRSGGAGAGKAWGTKSSSLDFVNSHWRVFSSGGTWSKFLGSFLLPVAWRTGERQMSW